MTTGRRLGTIVLCAAIALSTTFACGEKKGALMLAVSTDMKAPKDVNVVSLAISTNGTLRYSALGRVTPQGDVLFPATLAVTEPDDPDATIRVRVIAYQDRRARVLRDIRTTVPRDGRVALLRVPLSFVNDGSVTGELPASVTLPAPKGADGSGGGSTDALDPAVFAPNCPNPDDTWIDGECRDAAVDSNALPSYSDEEVFGAGGSPGNTAGSCFDIRKCFGTALAVTETKGDGGGEPRLVLDRAACTIALGAVTPATLNLALVTPDTGECLRDKACYVPLDRGPGWRDEGNVAKLAPIICKLLAKGFRLEASTSCAAKPESTPLCVDAAPIPACEGAACDGGTNDGPVSGDASEDGSTAVCKADGQTCATSYDCCSQDCDPLTKTCGKPPWTCLPPSSDCTASTQCCGLSCVAGKCSAPICTADNQTCSTPAQCCSGACTAGQCAPLPAACKTSGNPCAQDAQCCSQQCRSGVCNIAPTFCTQNGDVCGNDAECCGGLCPKQGGAVLGLCAQPVIPGAPGCAIAGLLCASPSTCSQCCSRVCEKVTPYGKSACLAPTGCRPAGDICKTDGDCCGSASVPTGSGSAGITLCIKAVGSDPVGRCENGVSCTPAGNTCKLPATACSASANCCSGNAGVVMSCLEDANGAPRCVVDVATATDCAGAGRAGLACASSADCCGFACVNNVCGTGTPAVPTCVAAGNACTANADCCKGVPCRLTPGTGGTCAQQPVATCALAGQQCVDAVDCCNNVPCSNFRCRGVP